MIEMQIFNIIVFTLTFLFILAKAIHYKNLFKKEKLLRLGDLPEYLDLATTDQLLQELRKRQKPMMILIPENNSLSIECHFISRENAGMILGSAIESMDGKDGEDENYDFHA